MSLDNMAAAFAHQGMFAFYVYRLVTLLVCVDSSVFAMLLRANNISPNAQSAGYCPLLVV